MTQLFWGAGLAAVADVARDSDLLFVNSVIAAVLALALLGQPITWAQAAAIVVACSAVHGNALLKDDTA